MTKLEEGSTRKSEPRNLTPEQAKFEEETGCCWFCGADPCQQAENCPYIEDSIANG